MIPAINRDVRREPESQTSVADGETEHWGGGRGGFIKHEGPLFNAIGPTAKCSISPQLSWSAQNMINACVSLNVGVRNVKLP